MCINFWYNFSLQYLSHHPIPPVVASRHIVAAHTRGRRESQRQEQTSHPFLFWNSKRFFLIHWWFDLQLSQWKMGNILYWIKRSICNIEQEDNWWYVWGGMPYLTTNNKLLLVVRSIKVTIKVRLGISRTNADYQWNAVYKAFHCSCEKMNQLVGSNTNIV